MRRTTSRPITARSVGVLLDQLLLVLHRASGRVDPERLAEFGIKPLADLKNEDSCRRTDVAELLLETTVDLDVLVVWQRDQQARFDEALELLVVPDAAPAFPVGHAVLVLESSWRALERQRRLTARPCFDRRGAGDPHEEEQRSHDDTEHGVLPRDNAKWYPYMVPYLCKKSNPSDL